jgi:N-acetylneuraminate synthase
VKKTEDTKLSKEDFAVLVAEVRNVGCIPMATPFDEASVDLCVNFDMPIIKVASSDVNDWPLLEKIASTRKPTIISSGGASEKNLDEIVQFFENRGISLAINHCVSLYPSEDHELELNQIDYLRHRYPTHVIGLSTHEYHDWEASMFISYGKGARTWERHIDIEADGIPVSSYCTTPAQADTWFRAYRKAVEMSGGSRESRRVLPKREIEYLDGLVRGVYAKRDIEPGYMFNKHSFEDDFYLAIPLNRGQLSCREIMNGEQLTKPIAANAALTIDHVDGPYSATPALRDFIINRGK